jgi:hypothetical protein
MDGRPHTGTSHERRGRATPLLLALLIACVALAGCESSESRALKTHAAALKQPLSALADQGDVEAMRVVADIEVLRSQSVFSDSAANALATMPGSAFIGLDAQGKVLRIERGEDLVELLAFTAVEQGLLKDGTITADDAADVRRLATDNMAAAAEKAKQLRSHHVSGMP